MISLALDQKLLMKARFRVALICTILPFVTVSHVLAETVSAEGFRTWLASFRPTAIASGIRAGVYDQVTRDLAPDFSLPDLDIPSRAAKQPGQPEFVRTPAEYLNETYLSNLAAQGRKLFAANKDTLASIRETYGVDPYLLLALWGRETAFGTYNLPHNALQVIATQAYAGKRKELFQRQFIFAIRLVQDGVIAAKDMKSSWAGAMGLAQFMPEEYYKYGVSLSGNGKPDLWHSVPDALASLANNISHAGWDKTQPWGLEVKAPPGVDCSLGYLDIRKPVREWAAMGITPLKGGSFTPETLGWEASLLQPAGIYGPAFLTFQNFQVIREYNKSDLYALFVAHLSDLIRGDGAFERRWDPIVQIPSADVEYMQSQLTALHFYGDTIDGKAGGRTRAAAGAYQKSAGLPQTCWPTAPLIAHLRAHEHARSSDAGAR
jgi:lytic murein transglycosylase